MSRRLGTWVLRIGSRGGEFDFILNSRASDFRVMILEFRKKG